MHGAPIKRPGAADPLARGLVGAQISQPPDMPSGGHLKGSRAPSGDRLENRRVIVATQTNDSSEKQAVTQWEKQVRPNVDLQSDSESVRNHPVPPEDVLDNPRSCVTRFLTALAALGRESDALPHTDAAAYQALVQGLGNLRQEHAELYRELLDEELAASSGRFVLAVKDGLGRVINQLPDQLAQDLADAIKVHLDARAEVTRQVQFYLAEEFCARLASAKRSADVLAALPPVGPRWELLEAGLEERATRIADEIWRVGQRLEAAGTIGDELSVCVKEFGLAPEIGVFLERVIVLQICEGHSIKGIDLRASIVNCWPLLPVCLCFLTDLEDLVLSFNGLTDVPGVVFALPYLETLRLDNNTLWSVPEGLTALSSLSHLDYSNNHLNKLPEKFFELRNLTKLDLSNNRFSRFPAPLLGCTNLVSLNLGGNRYIGVVPNEISRLSKLQFLDLSKTKIKDLPPALADCSLLADIRLGGTKLASVPNCLLSLPNLRRLELPQRFMDDEKDPILMKLRERKDLVVEYM